MNVRSSFLLLAVGLTLGACSSTQPASTPGPAPVASASASAVPSKDGPRHMMAFGPAGIFFHNADDLKLDTTQRTKIDALEKDLRDDKGSPHAEMKALREEIVAGIRAGKIDMTKIEPKQSALEKAMDARRDAEATALDGLHKVLTPEQRTALVTAIRAKMDKKKGWGGGMNKGMGGNMPGMRIKLLTKHLDLDDAQQKKVEAILPKDAPKIDHDARKKMMSDLLDAFAKADFSAKKQDAFTAKPPTNAAAHLKFLSDLVPILKPEQREKLADRMSKPHGGTGPKGAPPPAAKPADDDDDDD